MKGHHLGWRKRLLGGQKGKGGEGIRGAGKAGSLGLTSKYHVDKYHGLTSKYHDATFMMMNVFGLAILPAVNWLLSFFF